MAGHEETDLTRDDFETMAVERIERLTGIPAPGSEAGSDALRAYRHEAYRSYMLDRGNAAEWGTATQATDPPHESDEEDDPGRP